jgi:long-chain acyl-CoA synthetase
MVGPLDGETDNTEIFAGVGAAGDVPHEAVTAASATAAARCRERILYDATLQIPRVNYTQRRQVHRPMPNSEATALNLASVLDQQLIRGPGRTAVVWAGMRLSYAQLDGMASQVAAGLVAMGIRPGDHVALLSPNLPYFPVAYFGILKAGAVVVPLNVLLRPRELAYHLRDSESRALLCFEGTPELPMAQMAQAGVDVVATCRELIVMTTDPSAMRSPIEGTRTLAQLMHRQPAHFETHPSAPDDTAVILYTSGTTGQAKGAELTHLNMLLNAMVVRDIILPVIGGAVENITAVTLPLFHSTGQTGQMNAVLYAGGTMVLLPKFDPAVLIETITRERVTHWIGVPTMYWALLEYVRRSQIDVSEVAATLRLAVSGGAPMPVEVMKAFEQTFNVRVIEGYGLSETAPVAAFNHLERPSKPGTVGQSILGVQIRCVDENDEPVAVGAPGEVVIRGPNVMKGYYNRPEATAEVMRNGWFHTGDIGTIDTEGYLSIVDRKKDMIIRGGFNVYPRELEEVLMTHPAISLAAVVGVPHQRLGEEVKAFIVLKPDAALTEEALLAWCREQFAAYKHPRHIEFRQELPTSATGKILKRVLREPGATVTRIEDHPPRA